MLMSKIAVVALRAELNIDQEDLAREAGVDQGTISNLERGKPVLPTTAYKILFAINRLRKKSGLDPLAFDDISWNR